MRGAPATQRLSQAAVTPAGAGSTELLGQLLCRARGTSATLPRQKSASAAECEEGERDLREATKGKTSQSGLAAVLFAYLLLQQEAGKSGPQARMQAGTRCLVFEKSRFVTPSSWLLRQLLE